MNAGWIAFLIAYGFLSMIIASVSIVSYQNKWKSEGKRAQDGVETFASWMVVFVAWLPLAIIVGTVKMCQGQL